MALEPYGDLARHLEWADAEMWRAVLAAPETRSAPDLLERLHHIHVVQRAFLEVWQGRPLELPRVEDFDRLEGLYAWITPWYPELAAYVENLRAEDLGDTIVMPWQANVEKRLGKVHPTDRGGTLLQVTSHTTHHRSQISLRLRQLGAEPPRLDYILWLWLGRPAPRWEEAQAG